MHYIKQQHIKDLIYILIFSILMLLLLLKVNAFDLLIKYTRAHEEYQLDEVILLVLISSFSFIWFSLRRLKELKILKDKLSVQNNNLEEKIKKELKTSLEKEKILFKQARMALMGEMINHISHQWKQPLSVIRMSNTLLEISRDKLYHVNENDLDEAIKNIDDSVQNLSDTIDDFRDFFQINKQITQFSLTKVFNKVLKLIENHYKNSHIIIHKNIEHENAYGFESDILQVLLNILRNAKDELERKDLKLKRHLFIHVYRENEQIIIKIKDNGGGIKEENLNKLFEAYFISEENSENLGTGLYMCKQIITNMKGQLSVINSEYEFENEHYKGAEFIISIPINN